jgi:hypothetical protein
VELSIAGAHLLMMIFECGFSVKVWGLGIAFYVRIRTRDVVKLAEADTFFRIKSD